MQMTNYIEKGRLGVVKLDSEIGIDNDMILIGNPCLNKITNELMNEPYPCDKEFNEEKSYYMFIEKNKHRYVVVAGKDNIFTRKAAESLKSIFGKEMVIEKIPLKSKTSIQTIENRNTLKQIDEVQKKENKTTEIEHNQTVFFNDSEAKPLEKVDENIFQKLFNWIRNLFGAK
jgi:hypothetical protein